MILRVYVTVYYTYNCTNTTTVYQLIYISVVVFSLILIYIIHMNMYVDFHKWMDEWVDRWIGRHIMTRRHFEKPNKHESTGSLFFFQFVGYTVIHGYSVYIYTYTIIHHIIYPIVVVTYTPVYPQYIPWFLDATGRRSPHLSSRSRSLVDGAPRGAPSEYLRWRPGRRSRIPVAGEDTKSLRFCRSQCYRRI